MDDYTAAADKLFTEVDHLERLLDTDNPNIALSLSVAKRVRRAATITVQRLAEQRDQLHSQEADKR